MTDQTPLLSDGLLGWPGFGPGGSQQWKAQRLYTNDIWYAPRSGFYLIAGCGGGGGGGGSDSTGSGGGGGGSGATLALFPLYLPEGAGGVVTIGSGGAGGAWTAAGSNGSATSLGSELILGGGYGGASATGGASGLISGYAKIRTKNLLVSQGGPSGDGSASIGGGGGSSFVLNTSLTTDIAADFIAGLIGISHGGYGGPAGGAGQPCGSGGGGGLYISGTGGAGANGALIIAWVGVL